MVDMFVKLVSWPVSLSIQTTYLFSHQSLLHLGLRGTHNIQAIWWDFPFNYVIPITVQHPKVNGWFWYSLPYEEISRAMMRETVISHEVKVWSYRKIFPISLMSLTFTLRDSALPGNLRYFPLRSVIIQTPSTLNRVCFADLLQSSPHLVTH